VAVVGCGGGGTPAKPIAPQEDHASAAAQERARRDRLAARHREMLDEQATALAGTCAKPAAHVQAQRCTPTCYTPAPADPRAGKKPSGAVAIMHLVCTRGSEGEGPFLIVDELGKLDVRAVRGKVPKAGKKRSWQAEVEAATTAALGPEVARGDVVRVAGAWATIAHPVTKERLHCVEVAHHAKALRRALDTCGGQGAIACEAGGNAAVHGLDVVHYRLAEAKHHAAAGRETECQQAALEAIAVARGMPRWRQYMTLNTDQWKPVARYRTRFDGVLDEDTLFSTAIALGGDAEKVYVECGGPASPKTTVGDEQSFHTCKR
jgi:hypothetical protein